MAPSSCRRGIEHRYAHELFAHSDAGSVPAAVEPVSSRYSANRRREAASSGSLAPITATVELHRIAFLPWTVAEIIVIHIPAAPPPRCGQTTPTTMGARAPPVGRARSGKA